MRKDGEIPPALMEIRTKGENPITCVFKATYKVSNIPFFFPTMEKNLGQASRRDYFVEFIRNAEIKLNKWSTPLLLEQCGQMP